MMKIKNKFFVNLITIAILGLFIISLSPKVDAKYIFQNEFCIANLNIDRTKPKINLIKISNNNKYPNYANKTHLVELEIDVIDKNLKDVFLDNNHIKVKVGKEYINNVDLKVTKVKDIENGVKYTIGFVNLERNGFLNIEFIAGTAVDAGGLESENLNVDTKIIIDNIKPVGKFTESKISDGKVNGKITLSEKIVELDGWKFSGDKLTAEKEFTNNISYELPIEDYAGNKSVINVDITKATYINVAYASHNSVVGWSFGYGNYDVAGKTAIKVNPVYKSEALAFKVSGNMDKDFLQAKSYIYTYWGESSFGKCTTSGMKYNYGYNPLGSGFKSMASSDLVTINGEKYFQFGGSGINGVDNPDANGNNPIPGYVANKYRYGISGVQFKLKNYSQYSVVYQIFVDEIGWTKACSDGQECMYAKNKPMSAFRIVLVPNTEKQYVIDTWNKDAGTSNLK